MKGHYINNQNVKKRIKEYGKQSSAGFIRELDIIVEKVIDAACRQFDGSGKRLTSSLIPKKYK